MQKQKVKINEDVRKNDKDVYVCNDYCTANQEKRYPKTFTVTISYKTITNNIKNKNKN